MGGHRGGGGHTWGGSELSDPPWGFCKELEEGEQGEGVGGWQQGGSTSPPPWAEQQELGEEVTPPPLTCTLGRGTSGPEPLTGRGTGVEGSPRAPRVMGEGGKPRQNPPP